MGRTGVVGLVGTCTPQVFPCVGHHHMQVQGLPGKVGKALTS